MKSGTNCFFLKKKKRSKTKQKDALGLKQLGACMDKGRLFGADAMMFDANLLESRKM
jgi:hypothetical protein